MEPQIRYYGGFELVNYKPEAGNSRKKVLEGLLSSPKYIPTFYHYDEQGSALFHEITELPEYYLTRLDIEILRRHGAEIAEALGTRAEIVEYGSGMNEKTLILLESLDSPAAYIPIDISIEPLLALAREISSRFPGLRVLPVCADFNSEFSLPYAPGTLRKVVYFPGSTIGNFSPEGAQDFMRRCAKLVGPSGGMLIGVDLRKDPAVIEAAYNDSAGVTRKFGMNLLRRLARDFDIDVPLENFHHISPYNVAEGRIEAYLVCDVATTLLLDGHEVDFAKGERVFTEYSHKFSLPQFAGLAEGAGFSVSRVWTDERQWFSYHWLRM